MRTFGILAIFGLTLVAIGEAAYLIHLARRIEALDHGVRVAAERPLLDLPPEDRPPRLVSAPIRPRDGGVPRLAPIAFTAPPPAPGNTAAITLREALSTADGREQLRAALDLMKEEDRRGKLLKKASGWDERDQKWREKLTKLASLQADEQNKIGDVIGQAGQARAQILSDMQLGLKTSKEAGREIKDLQDKTEKEVRSVLGDKRAKELRDAERRQRDQERAQARGQERQPEGGAQGGGAHGGILGEPAGPPGKERGRPPAEAVAPPGQPVPAVASPAPSPT
jgi:hypothetical protein